MTADKLSKDVIVICGPTASGKSSLAHLLAQTIGGAVVSADSMQIYRRLDIGTDKATESMRREVPYRMLDIVDPDASYSVADYGRDATEVIRALLEQDITPIVCGGTGQYINTLLDGLRYPEVDITDAEREEFAETIREDNAAEWHQRIVARDPASGERIKPQDIRRIRRFFEILHATGKTQSEIYRWSREKGPDFSFLPFVLFPDRQLLYRKINTRVIEMFAEGLVDEVRGIYRDYPHIASCQSFRAIGYRETLKYINGEIDREEAIEKIQLTTRHYAKRQFTWFRSRDDLNIIENIGIKQRLDDILSKFNRN